MDFQEAINSMVKEVDFNKYSSVQLSYLRDEIGKEIGRRFQARVNSETEENTYDFNCKALRVQSIQQYMENKEASQKRADTLLEGLSKQDRNKVEGLLDLRKHAIRHESLHPGATEKLTSMLVYQLEEFGIDNPEKVISRLS
tara:strand:+ start:78 stop:503 length:426 start_codon:yes stop_codon:yes gene_type:complete